MAQNIIVIYAWNWLFSSYFDCLINQTNIHYVCLIYMISIAIYIVIHHFYFFYTCHDCVNFVCLCCTFINCNVFVLVTNTYLTKSWIVFDEDALTKSIPEWRWIHVLSGPGLGLGSTSWELINLTILSCLFSVTARGSVYQTS